MVDHSASDAMKVLHVTEASGGGVLQVVTRLARHQHDAGADVSIAFTERYDTPSTAELQSRFNGCKVTRLGGGSTLEKLWRIFRFVRRSLCSADVDVIHLHSSYAGLAGRLARLSTFRQGPSVVYSAHAYGFLRTDISKVARLMIFTAEAVLSRFSSGTVAISTSEAKLALKVNRRSKVRVLANVLSVPPVAEPKSGRPVIANIGRLVPQKGPERFALAADRLSGIADFVWIGGPTAETDQVLMSSKVKVTGNLPPETALKELARATIHLFTSRWEGMPLALMESQAMGIPAVAWECAGTSDVVYDGETGFIVRSEAEMLDRLTELLENSNLRGALSTRTRETRARFSDAGYGERSLQVYLELMPSTASTVAGRERNRVSG